MTSENIKDHKFLDLLDLSDSEVEEWIPDTDEEWAVTNEEDYPEPSREGMAPLDRRGKRQNRPKASERY
ncbi:hypothetical protein PoB_000499000 [Plakobranchus ocellatus]|uniref:Uncharacterized protein n=1 Tax=Plakobranchus ocellatus TaxID=259542 RepID=A0AAV3Y5U8_9GAST|nr:hypothetical protein PoB_000499000 [Plakobranchus ocellatus]